MSPPGMTPDSVPQELRHVARRPRPAAPSRWSALLLAGVLLTPFGAAEAQLIPGVGNQPRSETRPAETTPTQAAEPQAIPPDQIPAQLEATRELIRRANEAGRPQPEIESVRTAMDAIAGRMAELMEINAAGELAVESLRSLENSREEVASLQRTIAGWQMSLGRHAATIGTLRDNLAFTARAWSLTEAAARRDELPGDLLASVRNIQPPLAEAAGRVIERHDEVLALQGRLADWNALVVDKQMLVEQEFARIRADLFHPDHSPLWRGFDAPEAADFSAARDSWLREWAAVRAYLETRQANLWAQITILLVLAVAFLLVRRSLQRTPQDTDQSRPLEALRYPFAAALVLTILLGRSLYPGGPPALRELFGVLLVLPLIRLLPVVVAPPLRGLVYLPAILYLMLRLNQLLGSGTALERAWLLLLTLAAGAALAWVFRPGGPAARLHAGRLWSVAQQIARLGLAILALSLLANVVGLVSLSALLTAGVVSSTFIAIVFFTGVAVMRAAVIALLRAPLLQKINLVRWHAAGVDLWLMRILPPLAVLGWILATARLFGIEALLAGWVSKILYSSASIGTVQISLGDILAFILAIWLGLLVSRFLRFVLTVDVFPRVTLPRGVAATISMLVNYTVIGLAVVMAVAAAGIQLDRFAIIVGALSVGIGFGLQNVVNNFVSGLILAFERPVQSGDTVQLDQLWGTVSRIGVRSSTVRTFEGAEVIVPNANLISQEVTNWTLSDYRRRMEILVGVAYGTNPRKVMEVLLNAAKADDRLLSNPEPSVLFLGFGDSSLDFSLRAWTDQFDSFVRIRSDLTLAVHDGLYANDIEIPFPQRDLHLRSVDPQAVARIGAVQAPPVGDEGDTGASPGKDKPAT
jgi:potassium-dependent mechanosensitive channel